jgi:hypothetical protein
MKQLPKLLFTFLLIMFFGCTGFSQEKAIASDQRYIFFFHNGFIEQNDLSVAQP